MDNTVQKRIRSYCAAPGNEYRMGSLPHAFISYSHNDGEQYALDMYAKLLENDFAVWLDGSLVVGQDYDAEIEGAVRECDIFIFIVTPEAVESKYIIKKELEWAAVYGKPILPVVIEIPEKASFGVLSKKAEELIGRSVDCHRYSTADSFTEEMLKAAENYIVPASVREEVESAVRSQKHLRVYDWPLYDRYLIALAYLKGIILEKDVSRGTALLKNIIQSPAGFLGEDEKHTVSLSQIEMGRTVLAASRTDEERAAGLQYYIDALNNGNARAGYLLFHIYISGSYGIAADREKAAGFCLRAAEKGDTPSMVQCARYARREKKYSEAIGWYEEAAKKGDSFAMGELGKIYRDGMCGQAVDGGKAIKWFEKAAEKGDSYAMAELGAIYRDGLCGQAIDGGKAVEWFEKAAKKGDSYAMGELGKIYRDGLCGQAVDGGKAVGWFEKAAKKGDSFAMIKLGKIYRDGLCGQAVDGIKAVKWLEKAAAIGKRSRSNNIIAMYALYQVCQSGMEGLPADQPEAEKWLAEARKYNNERGDKALDEQEILSGRQLSEEPEEQNGLADEDAGSEDTGSEDTGPVGRAVSSAYKKPRRSAANWLISFLIILALAAAAGVRLSGLYDILGRLFRLLG